MRKLEESKEQTVVDNSGLEELLRQDKTLEMRSELLRTFKDSRLFLPVIFRKSRFENAEIGDRFELMGQFGFDIEWLPGDGRKAVPLFTSLEIMNASGFKFSSAMAISMRDLAEMLRHTDECSTVFVNPFGSLFFDMPADEFLSQFAIVGNHRIKDIENDKLKNLLSEMDLSDDELKEELSASELIVPCIDEIDGTSFVLVFDDDDNEYLQAYTDLEEYEKGLEDDLEEIYPQAYGFSELAKAANQYLVINRASEAAVFRAENLMDVIK